MPEAANHPGSRFPAEIPYDDITLIVKEVGAGRPFSFAAGEAAFWTGGCLHETFRPHDDGPFGAQQIDYAPVPTNEEEIKALAAKCEQEMSKIPKGSVGDAAAFGPLLKFLMPLIIAILQGGFFNK